MTCFMKILQIKGIIRNLVYSIACISPRADFKFKQKYDPIYDKHSIYSVPNARNCILQYEMPFTYFCERCFKYLNFFKPRISLRVLERERIVAHKLAENCIFVLL